MRSQGDVGLTTRRASGRFDDFRVHAERDDAAGFSDDFSGERRLYEGTIEEVGRSYESGRYIIDTTATDLIGLSSFPEPALDFEFSADVELMAVVGEPGAAICDLAEQLPASVVVIGTSGRSGLRRAVMGSTSDHVIRHAPSPVLVQGVGDG